MSPFLLLFTKLSLLFLIFTGPVASPPFCCCSKSCYFIVLGLQPCLFIYPKTGKNGRVGNTLDSEPRHWTSQKGATAAVVSLVVLLFWLYGLVYFILFAGGEAVQGRYCLWSPARAFHFSEGAHGCCGKSYYIIIGTLHPKFILFYFFPDWEALQDGQLHLAHNCFCKSFIFGFYIISFVQSIFKPRLESARWISLRYVFFIVIVFHGLTFYCLEGF